MIGYLKGRLFWVKENKIIININGVGYIIEIIDPFNLPNLGEELELYIYTYVREDNIKLYGFQDMSERELFKLLISVSGIGPKVAINILASLPAERFTNAILTEDVLSLKQISGIGPKTAKRLILELKNKIEKLDFVYKTELVKKQYDDELIEALKGLGYSLYEIEESLNNVELEDTDEITEKIKKVLSYLGKRR